MGEEWEYFKNSAFGLDEIKVSVHDNYVFITEALRLAKFLTTKIYTGENEHED